ncbi:50S ribosomal protein L25 [Paenibacillus sp. SI8]|uniref:50S ribosomal protein L25 n=1 Tax=unclassified Paenibacillus TaxID=185978 RepID=UPI003464EB47
MKKMNLQAEIRTDFNGSAIRHLRKDRKVPAVVYGKMTSPIPIALDEKDVQKVLRNPNALIELESHGAFKKLVVLQAVQRNSFHDQILAVDFHQVDLHERVKAHIRIEPVAAPDGKMIPYQMFLHEIQVDCLPDQIPESIPLDLIPVRDGNAIIVKDLSIPEGVNVHTRADEVVAAPFHIRIEEATETESVE